MPKRVSLKGKGVDIFFGDYPPGTALPPTTTEGETGDDALQEPSAAVVPPEHAVSPIRRGRGVNDPSSDNLQHASKKASMRAVVHDRAGASESALGTPSPSTITPFVDPSSSVQDSGSASMLASDHAGALAAALANGTEPHNLLSHADVIETIRKRVKFAGKEVSFVRLSQAEKAQLADLVYSFKKQGKKTSENEINRIAVNYILEDYEVNGEASILARVLDALLA